MSDFSKGESTANTNENWMGDNYEKLKSRRINHIFLPATHNAGSTTIDFSKNYTSNPWIKLGNLVGRFAPRYYGNIFRDWTINQINDIEQQLNSGVRFFVIKVSYDAKNDNIFHSHTFVNQYLIDIVSVFKTFLMTHLKEVIIFQVVNDWEYRNQINNFETNLIFFNKLGEYFYPPKNEFPLYQEMVESDRRVIYIHKSYHVDTKYIWGTQHLNFPWNDASTADDKIAKLEKTLDRMLEPDINHSILNILTFQLTPTVEQVKRDVFYKIFFLKNWSGPTNLKQMADEIEARLVPFLEKNKTNFGKLSGISFDFLNEKMIDTLIKFYLLLDSP